jgi:hypothetical protein
LLRLLDRDMQVDVDQGTLIPSIESFGLQPHRLEQLLVSTSISFSIVVLDYGEKRHPEAYSVAPYIDRIAHPGQPHLRLDRVISHGGRTIPALCVYSAAEYRYSATAPRLVEFLDQTATYLAKHVIWLRTRRLYDAATGALLYAPQPGEIIMDTETRDMTYMLGVCKRSRQSRRIWSGYWPGTTAAMGPVDHTRTIQPDSSCWCGSGERYGSCHRPVELAWLRATRR